MYAESLSEIAMMHADSLILNAQKGNEQALNQLVELWYKRIYNYAFKYLKEEELTADVAQKTFIAMFKNIKKLKDINRFKPWLYRIATNYCHEEDRKRKKNRMVPLTISQNEEDGEVERNTAEGKFFNPEKKFQQLELEDILLESLNELSHEQRTTVLMKEYEGLKFREIAEALVLQRTQLKHGFTEA